MTLIAGAVTSHDQVRCGRAALSGRVRERNRLLVGRLRSPWRAIEASTVFFVTFHPTHAGRRTRGDPSSPVRFIERALHVGVEPLFVQEYAVRSGSRRRSVRCCENLTASSEPPASLRRLDTR
jgi:hypothetical protein